jgi:uncharacterized membrane protein YfcA
MSALIASTFMQVALTMVAGAVAGCFGALLGIGGGIFLVPFLNLVMGLSTTNAFGISLITVIATSSVVSASSGRLQVANLRLGMVLEIFTTIGGVLGGYLVYRIGESTRQLVFGWTMAAIAVVMLTRLKRRNVIRDPSIDVGVLGGRYHEDESGGEVAYRVTRVPLAFLISTAAGVLATLAGIGGGVLKVPALNAWCGVPMRAAAATSALMIGVTAMVGAIIYFAHGDIKPDLAAAAVLGVLAGSKAGFRIAARSRAMHLKGLMAFVLAAVAILYFVRAMR